MLSTSITSKLLNTSLKSLTINQAIYHLYNKPKAQIQHKPKSHISPTIWRQNASFPAINTSRVAPKGQKPHNSHSNREQENSENSTMARAKQFWLLKTEPGEWSWDDQAANGGVSKWDGVKNKQALKYLKSMKVGDLCFFYHSGTKSRCVVGVVSVIREWYTEEDGGGDGDGDGAVDVKAVGEMRRQVDLKEMKGDEGLKGFVMFRQPRLSVVAMEECVWKRVCEIGGGFDGDGREEDEYSGGVIEMPHNLA